jgi:hypothetical protein
MKIYPADPSPPDLLPGVKMNTKFDLPTLFYGFILGTFVSFLIIFIFNFDMIDSTFRENIFQLLGTFSTLFAGFLAYQGIQKQINQTRNDAEEAKKSKLRAARSALPITVSNLVYVSRSMIESFFGKSVYNDWYFDKGGAISRDQMETLKQCIEYADDVTSDRLAHIIRLAQLLNARFEESYFKAPVSQGDIKLTADEHSKLSYLVLWVVYDALLNSVFGFSRGVSEAVPPNIDPNGIYGVFSILGVERDDYPRLFEMLDGRVKNGRLDYKFNVS